MVESRKNNLAEKFRSWLKRKLSFTDTQISAFHGNKVSQKTSKNTKPSPSRTEKQLIRIKLFFFFQYKYSIGDHARSDQHHESFAFEKKCSDAKHVIT